MCLSSVMRDLQVNSTELIFRRTLATDGRINSRLSEVNLFGVVIVTYETFGL